MKWICKPYDELTLNEFHDIIALRIDVFVIEQNCPYQDVDGKDKKSYHLFGVDDDGEVVAYSRILPAGVSYKEVAIGRVVTSQKIRGTGIGYELMNKSMEQVSMLFGEVPVRLSAQQHLKKYYESFGFEQVSEMYLEDGIPHVEMLFEKE